MSQPSGFISFFPENKYLRNLDKECLQITVCKLDKTSIWPAAIAELSCRMVKAERD